jgi:hypothetical protein
VHEKRKRLDWNQERGESMTGIKLSATATRREE